MCASASVVYLYVVAVFKLYAAQILTSFQLEVLSVCIFVSVSRLSAVSFGSIGYTPARFFCDFRCASRVVYCTSTYASYIPISSRNL